jgi:hypothetical protein
VCYKGAGRRTIATPRVPTCGNTLHAFCLLSPPHSDSFSTVRGSSPVICAFDLPQDVASTTDTIMYVAVYSVGYDAPSTVLLLSSSVCLTTVMNCVDLCER